MSGGVKRRRSQGEIWGHLGLIVFGAVLALGICEIFVRLVLPLPPGFSWVRRDGLVLHVPGMKGVYRRPEFRTEVSINREGLRGPEIPTVKAPGSLRILLVGDSYAEGLQVAGEELLSSRLERLLNQGPGPRVEVINAGVSGYGTTDELALLENLGWGLQPDLVLLLFCIHNDVKDNLDRPLFDFSTEPPRRLGPSPLGSGTLAWMRTKEFLSRHSQLYQLVRDRMAEIPQLDRGLVRWGLRRRGGNAAPAMEPVRTVGPASWFKDPPEAEFSRGLEYTRKLLAKMQQEGREHRSGILVVWVPLREQVDDRRWEVFGKKHSLTPESRTRPQELLVRAIDGMGLESIDLLPVFRRSPRQESLYFDIDGHWTASGHLEAAEAVAPSLRTWRESFNSVGSKMSPEGRDARVP